MVNLLLEIELILMSHQKAEQDTFRKKNCPDDTFELEEYCSKTCKKDCRETTFLISVQERFKGFYDRKGNIKKDIEDEIKVEIYLNRYEVTVHKHSTKYMNFELFSSIGGFIGIWLGVSLLDIADIFERFFRVCRFLFKKKREHKKIALATQ